MSIPADLLATDPAALPQPADGSRVALLSNHVQVAGMYHALADDFRALVCAVTGQAGVLVNGAEPMRPEWCEPHGKGP